jgi:predicted dinucleotide-binding enzyme
MNIAVVGTGNVGRALGGGWLKVGHMVTMVSREPSSTKATNSRRRVSPLRPQGMSPQHLR